MLEVKIPEDIRKHEDKMFFGFSIRQLVTLVISGGAGVLVYFLFKSLEIAGLFAIVCSILGFSNFDKRIKPFVSYLFKPKNYVFMKTFDFYNYMLDREVENAIVQQSEDERATKQRAESRREAS